MTDWLPELSDDDLATLLEALEAWEENTGSPFEDLLAETLKARSQTKGQGPTPEMVTTILEAAEQRGKQRAVSRKERSVLLRAKLLTLRDRRRVERITNEA